MIELIVGTYGFFCWLLFSKLRWIPTNTYTVCTAILGGFVILFAILISLSICHPASNDGRLYSVSIPIVSQVRGLVTDVPVTANQLLEPGEVLFRIDPRPYQIEVERLEASLAAANSQVAQLEARLAAAESQTRFQRSNLLVSESDNDRQARVALEQATQQIAQSRSRLVLAQAEFSRNEKLLTSRAVSQDEYDKSLARVQSLEAEFSQAVAAETGAQEKLKSGSDRMQAARESLAVAEAQELEARVALETNIEGVNPEVRQIMAQLDAKRWDLEQTVVRAPGEGFVTQLFMRPGQMAVPFPPTAPMVFVPSERPSLVASFPQNVVMAFEPGMEAELAFKAYPGRIFRARVASIMPIIPEGTAIASGQLRSVTSEFAAGRIPVVFEYGDDLRALNLPIGSQATVSVYTHNLHVLGILRKIILRIKSWENYILVPIGGGH